MAESLSIHELDPADHAAWDALVQASTQGTVYHGSQWLRAIARLSGTPVSVYGIFAGTRLVAGVPLQVRRRGPIRIAQRALATPYAGVVVRPDAWESMRPSLKAAAGTLARRFSCLSLAGSPFVDSLEAQLSWHAEARATYVLRSRSLEGLWRSLASEVRNRIRKAEREGVTVRIETGTDDFFEIYRDVFARQGMPIAMDATAFKRFLAEITTLGVGRLYAARLRDSRLCAACLMVYDRHRAYYSLAASHAELRKNGSPSLLVWEAIQNLFESYDELDFGGANVPHVAQFKSKFRGRRIEYPEVIAYRSGLERAAIHSLRQMRRYFGR